MSGRAVLVTGASGRLGRRVAEALRARGWRVRSLVHRRPAPAADERIAGSVLDEAALARASEGMDAVVHLAAVTHARRPASYFEVNAVGTRNLVAAAAAAGIERFVLVSTRAIDRSGGAYSCSKAAAEEAVRSSGLDYAIVRLPEVYGLGGDEGVERILDRASRGRRVLVAAGDHSVSPMHVDDAVAACIGALEREGASGKTFTLAGDCMSFRELAAAAARAAGTSSTVTVVPQGILRAAATVARFVPLPLYPDQLARLRAPKPRRTESAERELGFAYRSLPQGLRDLRLQSSTRG